MLLISCNSYYILLYIIINGLSFPNVQNIEFFHFSPSHWQGSRIEDQRSSLPNESSLTHSAPTVPDDDFFSLIMRFQSGRLEDQRSTMPLEAASRSVAHHRTTTDEEEPPPPPTSTQPSTNSKDGLVSRLVKGRKWACLLGKRCFIDLIFLTRPQILCQSWYHLGADLLYERCIWNCFYSA